MLLRPLFLAALASVSPSVMPAGNLLPVENPGAGDRTWTAFAPAPPVSFAIIDAGGARFDSADFALQGLTSPAIPAAPGERYRVSARVRTGPETTARPGSPGGVLRVAFYAGETTAPLDHRFVTTGGLVSDFATPPLAPPASAEWSRVEAVVEVPAGADQLRLQLFSWFAKGPVLFADIALEKVSADTPATAAPPMSGPDSGIPVKSDDQRRRELFAALDWSRPDLAYVREAVESGDLVEAQTRFAAHLRARRYSTWRFDPHTPDRATPFNREIAEAAVEGRVSGGLVPVWKTFPENQIDWFHNETSVNGGPYNAEWQWQLNRMHFWLHLAGAYRATGDERYARAWREQFRSFIARSQAPLILSNQRWSAWRTIECGIRMQNAWPTAFHSFLLSPSVSDEDLILFAHASLEHARYLSAFPTVGNWLTMEMNGLYTIGTNFPEFADAAGWRALAVQNLAGLLDEQFLPDGAHYELTPSYHIVTLRNILAVPRLAELMGRSDEIPADFTASLERAFDFVLRLATPDRNLPRFNDAWPDDVRSVLAAALPYLPHREDYRWIATDGREGNLPGFGSHSFPWSGYQVMRSGWQTNANYAAFDTGFIGYAHTHQDKLNLVVWSHGREILFDSGGGSYERSKWRDYGIDTFSHNTVIVDGLPQRRWRQPVRRLPPSPLDEGRAPDRTVLPTAPVDARWHSTPAFDRATGTYDEGYGEEGNRVATHVRRVLFIKPDLFLVADTLTPNDDRTHDYQARWHLLPTDIRRDGDTVITADAGLSNLAVIPLDRDGLVVSTASGQTEPELLGWDVRKDLDPQYVAATTVVHAKSGPGVRRFTTLLAPMKPGADNPVASVQPSADGESIKIRLTDGRALRLVIPRDTAKDLSFESLR